MYNYIVYMLWCADISSTIITFWAFLHLLSNHQQPAALVVQLLTRSLKMWKWPSPELQTQI